MAESWRDIAPGDYGVIGDPVGHSKSPSMHGAAYRALGVGLEYRAILVPRGEVRLALDHLLSIGYRGINVTVPHKEEAIAWCSEVEPFAAKVRSVNTIDLNTRKGINTDAPGFLSTLQNLGLPGKSALILGAGGSARALAAALADDGWALSLWNRSVHKAVDLAASVGARVLEAPLLEGIDLILNTTSASLSGDRLPLDWEAAKVGALAYDLAYGAGPTPFLEDAARSGLRTMDGLPMLVEQGALALEFWLHRPAPREAMREALR